MGRSERLGWYKGRKRTRLCKQNIGNRREGKRKEEKKKEMQRKRGEASKLYEGTMKR